MYISNQPVRGSWLNRTILELTNLELNVEVDVEVGVEVDVEVDSEVDVEVEVAVTEV